MLMDKARQCLLACARLAGDEHPALDTVITGSEDEFAPPGLIKKMAPPWNSTARIHVIEGADHFYFGFDRELKRIISERIK